MRVRLLSLLTRKILVVALNCLLLTTFSSLDALSQDISVTDQLIGSWQGQGKLFGMDAAFEMKWQRILNEQFIHLTFQNRISGANGSDRILKAQAFYKHTAKDSLEGTWFDSRGMILPLKSTIEPAKLITHWGSPQTEQGRTEYQILNNDQIEVTDLVLRDEQWHQFGNATYNRIEREP